MIKKVIDRISLILWIGFSTIFLLSLVTKLEIISPIIRNMSFLLTISGLVFLIFRILKIKISDKINRIVILFSIILGPFIISWLDPMGAWKTQTIIYNHGHLKCKTIEFQMQDKGSIGYNRRIVEVTKLAGFLRITEPIDTNKLGLPWIRVDKDINELKLKKQ
jgi:hypothetical protein